MGKVATRHRELLRQLAAEGSKSVEDLASSLKVAEATVRRDLQRLAATKRVVRIYGGAAIPGAPVLGTSADDRAKGLIAQRAATLVGDDETIVVTGGTTTLAFARALLLEPRRLTVITNALDVAYVLLDRAGIELIVLGGSVRPRMHSLLGPLTALTARELRAHQLFMGAFAVNPAQGLMNDHVPEVLTDRALKGMADRITLLADASKFTRTAPAFVMPIAEVHRVVTDSRVDASALEALRGTGVDVEVCPAEAVA